MLNVQVPHNATVIYLGLLIRQRYEQLQTFTYYLCYKKVVSILYQTVKRIPLNIYCLTRRF